MCPILSKHVKASLPVLRLRIRVGTPAYLALEEHGQESKHHQAREGAHQNATRHGEVNLGLEREDGKRHGACRRDSDRHQDLGEGDVDIFSP